MKSRFPVFRPASLAALFSLAHASGVDLQSTIEEIVRSRSPASGANTGSSCPAVPIMIRCGSPMSALKHLRCSVESFRGRSSWPKSQMMIWQLRAESGTSLRFAPRSSVRRTLPLERSTSGSTFGSPLHFRTRLSVLLRFGSLCQIESETAESITGARSASWPRIGKDVRMPLRSQPTRITKQGL